MAFDTEYDLVVVGGGASGKSAALEAARAGKSVVILEKMPETGGLSMFAEGTAAFESSEQKKLGKPAHPDRHFPTKQEGYDKFNAYSHYRANFDVVRAFVDNSADTIDFLKDLGVEYKTVTIAAYDDPNEVWTFHLPDGLGARVQELLLSAVEHAGVDIFTETPATELIIEDGKVVGVVAESEGEPLRVGGKAVVLATGGMGSNPELIAKYSWFAPSAYNMNTLTPLQNMGDGLMMALSAGADDTNIVTCPILAAGARDKAMDSHIGAAGVQPGAIWINKTGRRFANEYYPTSEQRGYQTVFMSRKTKYAVVDNNFTEYRQYTLPQHAGFTANEENIASLRDSLDKAYAKFKGTYEEPEQEEGQGGPGGGGPMTQVEWIADDTLEGLAGQMGLSGDAATEFVAQIERWNGYCEAGVDEEFGRAAEVLFPVTDGPFYACTFDPVLGETMVTMGGIITDGEQNALDANYEPIPGLYMAGNDCGRRFGTEYVTPIPGCSLAFALVLGRECGKSVAKFLG